MDALLSFRGNPLHSVAFARRLKIRISVQTRLIGRCGAYVTFEYSHTSLNFDFQNQNIPQCKSCGNISKNFNAENGPCGICRSQMEAECGSGDSSSSRQSLSILQQQVLIYIKEQTSQLAQDTQARMKKSATQSKGSILESQPPTHPGMSDSVLKTHTLQTMTKPPLGRSSDKIHIEWTLDIQKGEKSIGRPSCTTGIEIYSRDQYVNGMF
jgi:hypothetical protein